MKRANAWLAGWVGCLLAGSMSLHAAVIIMDGSDGTSQFSDWQSQNPFGGSGTAVLTQPSTIGGATAALRMDVNAPAGQPAIDYIFGSGNLQGGNGNWWTLGGGVKGLTFDFYTTPGDTIPLSLNLYFRSSSGSGYFWYTTLPLPANDGWKSDQGNSTYPAGYAANVDYYRGSWQELSGNDSYADWSAALANVTEVGIWVNWPQGEVNTYAIDNFGLHDDLVVYTTPEPGTFLALGTALLSLGMTFRRKIGQSLEDLLKG